MMAFLRFAWNQWRKQYLLQKACRLRFPSLQMAGNVQITGPLEHLKLGEQVQFQSNVFIHLGGQEWCRNQGSLEIGAKSVLSPNVVIYAAGPGGVKIGKNFDCGPGVGIFSSRSDIEKIGGHVFAPVLIGDNVTIFANAVISPGVSIGDGAAIAANAVVTQDVPAYCLAGGVPAKKIRDIKKEV